MFKCEIIKYTYGSRFNMTIFKQDYKLKQQRQKQQK